jgi:phospholipase C
MRKLQSISIAFTTHSTTFVPAFSNPLVHVFVKNRRSDTSTPESDTDFLSNLFAWKAVEASPPASINPYLGARLALEVALAGWPDGKAIDIPLRTQEILPGEVVLPVVDVHLYSAGYGLWTFTYTIDFHFDDGTLSYTPADDGVPWIQLDSNNPSYSGICREANTPSAPVRPPTKPVYLQSVTLDFGTHGDDKAADTKLNVHIVNRKSAASSEDIVVAQDIFHGQAFPQPSELGPYTHLKNFPGDKKIVFGRGGQLPLASQQISLQEIVLPVVGITVAPTGGDRWIFDYRVTYTFSNGMTFSSTTHNVSLDGTSNKHIGVYNGRPFPTYSPPPTPAAPWRPQIVSRNKQIPLSLVRAKLKELLVDRQDPLFKFRFDSIRDFGSQRESYYDFQGITPDPPPPGTLSVPGYQEGVTWQSSPSSLGFLDHDAYFDNVNDESIEITIDDPADGPLPVTALLTFQTPFDMSYTVAGVGRSMKCIEFWIRLKFTLALDSTNHKVDVLRWVNDINRLQWGSAPGGLSYKGEWLGNPFEGVVDPLAAPGLVESLIDQGLVVRFTTDSDLDFGGSFQKSMRDKVFGALATPSTITHKSAADTMNDRVNAWLLGGIVTGSSNNRCNVSDVHVDGDALHISYTGPTYVPPAPANWPAGVDFTSGSLANIDHIVVLTKENRSFDHMLGYLSLPVTAGGQGRTDVDGLKGGEFNMLDGTKCPSFALEPEDTIFSPNPPQDPQRTLWEIDHGKMDGFVEAFADQDGVRIAPRIMGYHTAVNVPVYDALSRDFAICQRWFAPHPGPTFPNRFYELTGRLNRTPDGVPYTDNTESIPELDYGAPIMPALTKTIFDHLPSAVTWRYFENGGYCFLRMFADHTFDDTNIVRFDDPSDGFLALAKRGELPNVSFIDPHFIDIPPGASCDEPPSDVKNGQALVRQIVEAVVSSPQWNKTLLIITYDEHGGFFDHVPPPAAAKVTPESAETYGVRIPTFVVSPWVRPGSVFGHDGGPVVPIGPATAAVAPAPVAAPHVPVATAPLYFDHTSILKTIARRFIGAAAPYLGARFAAAHDLSSIFTATPRWNQFRPFIPYTLVYARTNGALEVQHDSATAGALLWQNTPNAAAEAQQFRLEDAGSGYYYLRTRVGNLYLTADPTLKVTQQPKHGAGSANQRWKFTPGIRPGTGFTIVNAAFPAKTLQPAGNTNAAGTAVVLGDPEAGPVVAGRVKNAWQVMSPLLPAAQIVAHPVVTPAP